jgi:hypothetical protein
MNIDIDDAILRLNPESNFQLRDARGACVHVHWGDLWITQEGDIKDHVVKTGESFAVSNSGITFLTAMSEAGVSIMEKCRESEVASAAETGTVALPATQHGADLTDVRYDEAGNGSSLGELQQTSLLPDIDELDRNIARAESLRAQFLAAVARYLADAVSNGLNSMRHSLGVLRQLG